MSFDLTPYATDEDIALRASADYTLLCPRDQKVAVGPDGVFLPGNPWLLSSPTVDFGGRGVQAGQVIQLKRASSGLRPSGEGFVIVSATPDGVIVRRMGMPTGAGEPPSPTGGLTSVEFLVMTFRPQIDLASHDLGCRLGIAPNLCGGGSLPLVDAREIRDATVLTVLSRQYFAMSRELGSASGGTSDTFAEKATAARAELDDVLARLALHGNASPYGPGPTTRFSTRMSR